MDGWEWRVVHIHSTRAAPLCGRGSPWACCVSRGDTEPVSRDARGRWCGGVGFAFVEPVRGLTNSVPEESYPGFILGKVVVRQDPSGTLLEILTQLDYYHLVRGAGGPKGRGYLVAAILGAPGVSDKADVDHDNGI